VKNTAYRWLVWILPLLLLLAGVIALYFYYRCLDGCGPYHNSASATDLDGDGDLDVVLSNLRHENETTVWAGSTFWINQGGGRFTPRKVELNGSSAAAGDLNSDGQADLFQISSGDVVLYIRQGGTSDETWAASRFQPGANLIYPGGHNTVLLGDLNNDGRLDAFVGACCGTVLEGNNAAATYFQSLAWVWLNTSQDGSFPTGEVVSQAALGDLPMQPALGDLDNDGDLDVFAALQSPQAGSGYDISDRVLLNDGSGNFTDSGQRLAAAGECPESTAAALADLDGDGDLDALVGGPDGALVWTNQGGVFADSGVRLPGGPISAVFLADFDGDGDPDALLAEKKQAALWWNDGPQGFSDSKQRLRFTERHGLAVDDFDADGDLDVFTASYNDQFRLWLNQGGGRLAASVGL